MSPFPAPLFLPIGMVLQSEACRTSRRITVQIAMPYNGEDSREDQYASRRRSHDDRTWHDGSGAQ